MTTHPYTTLCDSLITFILNQTFFYVVVEGGGLSVGIGQAEGFAACRGRRPTMRAVDRGVSWLSDATLTAPGN